MTSARGLCDISDSDLAVLASLLDAGSDQNPSLAWLQAKGVGHLGGPLRPFLGLSGLALRAVIAAVSAERTHRKSPKLTLVWTGDDPGVGYSRHTRVMLPELVAKARAHVLIAGYSFDHGAAIFPSLHNGIVSHGVTVELFVDIRQLLERLRSAAKAQRLDWGFLSAPLNAAITSEARGAAAVELFFKFLWPFGGPRPRIYFDPRTAGPENVVSLHAKCVVIDHEFSLITSANFTERGQNRNFEAGVAIEDRGFATTLERQWANLVEAGLLVETPARQAGV